MDTKQVCQFLMEMLERNGEELFEKNYYLKDGSIAASVFCIVGPNAEELTGLVREWANKNGLVRKENNG